jgi:hypothetical protein
MRLVHRIVLLGAFSVCDVKAEADGTLWCDWCRSIVMRRRVLTELTNFSGFWLQRAEDTKAGQTHLNFPF